LNDDGNRRFEAEPISAREEPYHSIRHEIPIFSHKHSLTLLIALLSSNVGQDFSTAEEKRVRSIQISNEFISLTMAIENDRCLSEPGSARSAKTTDLHVHWPKPLKKS
jgi:hypothetical protein